MDNNINIDNTGKKVERQKWWWCGTKWTGGWRIALHTGLDDDYEFFFSFRSNGSLCFSLLALLLAR